MPCYTVKMYSVVFQASSVKLLEEAAKLLKLTFKQIGPDLYQVGNVTVDTANKTATARYQTDINALKVAYSKAAIKQAANSKGWTLETWTEKNGIKKTQAVKY